MAVATATQRDALPRYKRDASPEILRQTEWLLTNGLGGFAMGTGHGAPMRRYHALLVAAMRPPVDRVAALHSLAEWVTMDGPGGEMAFHLSAFQFSGGLIHPRGHEYLVGFEKGRSCRWTYRVAGVEIVKEVYLFDGLNAVGLRYRVGTSMRELRLHLRPLVALRDHHGLVRASGGEAFRSTPAAGGVTVSALGRVLHLRSGEGAFESRPQWWYGFEYEAEKDRGFDFTEDLWSPGVFSRAIRSEGGGREVTLTAWMDGHEPSCGMDEDIEHRESRLVSLAQAGAARLAGPAGARTVGGLVEASDAFVVRREPRGGNAVSGVSVIAGYPWFTDWGRDTFVSLPGLFLATGRTDEARSVLRTFAAARSRGLIPNRFDDSGNGAEYNTVDGSLWFIHAACELAHGSAERMDTEVRAACLDIVDHYVRGTDYGIAMDPDDALVQHGDARTALTWMDAARDGVVFSPRHGKAVEVNALWHHALCALELANADEDPEAASRLKRLAARVKKSFRALFWDPSRGCCFDTLERDAEGVWRPTFQLRPNQIFAASLEHSPLTIAERRGVVSMVRARLLTPLGVRTLDPADPAYRGRYRGRIFDRDAAYHNGTAWPWLLGPLAEGILRLGRFGDKAREEARELMAPLLAQLDGRCPGQLPEVYDGDAEPQHADGCPAQAWSVAEALRMFVLINGA